MSRFRNQFLLTWNEDISNRTFQQGEPLPLEDIHLLVSDTTSLPYKDEESTQCSICYQTYQKAETMMVLRCTHTFHAVCLAQWFQRSHTCPKCRDDPGQDMPGPIDPACEGDVALYDSFRNTVWSTICAARDIRLRERRLRHGPEDELDSRVMATRYDVDAVARVLNYTRPSIRSRGSACANHFTLWPLMASARQRKDEAEGEYLARVAARVALTGGAADHEDNEDDPAVGAGEDQHAGESPGALTA